MQAHQLAPPLSLTNRHLLVIVLAQFAGTSLWFAGNAILPDLQQALGTSALAGWITSAVQLGFIAGTFTYALLGLADRYPTTRVFLASVVLAALFNLLFLALPLRAGWVLLSRFGTGFFLAGVYPVGMKIAADWFRPALGRAMGFLVGALVLGTASPHLLRGLGTSLTYPTVLISVSTLSVIGGLLLFATIPSKPVQVRRRLDISTFSVLFKPSTLRQSAIGYFGHMWELYAAWAFLPVVLAQYAQAHPGQLTNVSLWSFFGIAAGFVGCAGGGLLTFRLGSRRVASICLFISAVGTFLVPFTPLLPLPAFATYLFVYGIALAGDSPQLTTLVSANAPDAVRGSLLTMVTCIGFGITVVSIQLMSWLLSNSDNSLWVFWLLAPGPLLGLWGLWRRG